MTTYLKVLDEDGNSVHGGSLQWPLPTQTKDGAWMPGAWVEVEGDIEPCANGLHATDEAHLWTWLTNVTWRVWALEYDGDVIEREDKVVGRRARLLAPLALPAWWMDAAEAVAALKSVPWLANDGAPDPDWKVYETRDAARAAARAAARDAARDAARAAARDAAWDAARDAAWAAARDAADQIVFTSVGADLPIEQKYRDEIARRWRVWQKGYGLFAEVGGVLYVYKRVC